MFRVPLLSSQNVDTHFIFLQRPKENFLFRIFCPSHSSFVRRRSKFSYLRSRWKWFTLTIKKAYSRDKKGLFSWWKRFVVGMHSFKVDCCVFVSQRFGGWKGNFRCTFWLLFVVFRFADVLKDQPWGVAQTNVALNRVKASSALTLLCQKTNPKGLFSARKGFRLIIVVKQCIQGCSN